jgi:5-methylcytosine-specific restriction endonuclease McrA
MTPITRKAAKAAGLKYYFTGKPCKRGGHIDKRFVSSFTCRACAREKAKEHWDSRDAEQRERRSAYQRQRWRDPEHRQQLVKYREQSAEYRKRRKEANPDEFREHYAKNRELRKRQASEWYRKNTEYALERQKAYTAARPIELRRALGRRSRAKRRAIEKNVFVEVVDSRVVFDRDQGVCGICRELVEMTSQWEVDHIVPISKGGAHSYANVQLAHKKCNRSKGAKCD